jgi:plasmid stabilization system protein ParE
MTYSVRFTEAAEQDLLVLFDFLAEKDAAAVQPAQAALAKAIEFLALSPFSCRKAEVSTASPFLRELLIPFRSAGCVAMFEIEDAQTVTIFAVRKHREEDYS